LAAETLHCSPGPAGATTDRPEVESQISYGYRSYDWATKRRWRKHHRAVLGGFPFSPRVGVSRAGRHSAESCELPVHRCTR
jgi:hypothetical protein